MKARAFIVSAVLGGVVWALSIPITGKSEPWDAGMLYYVVALAVAGAIAGLIVPGRPIAHYLGAIFGQAAYELVFLKLGALFILGLVFLAGYSIVYLAAAAITGSLRKPRPDAATHPGEP